MAHYAFFLRVSTKKQKLESQYDEMVKYAKLDEVPKEDIITIQYKESGVNLPEEERLGILEFKELCAVEPITCCYISELSRVARTEKVLYSFIEFLQEHKIQLKCKNPSFTLFKEDFSSMDGNARILVGMFAALAAQEAVEKKMRFARGKERKATEGKYNGGAIPYGYMVDENQDNLIIVNEDEAKIVRNIYNMYENGVSQPSIAKELFERGVKGRAVKATKSITISLVHQILTNKLLTGEPNLNKGSSYTRQYPQIITKEQFERCRTIANNNNKCLPKTKYIHYAQGLIKCTECGRNYVSSGYKCNYHCRDAYNYNKKYDGYYGEPMCQNHVCISENIMDSLLWELAKDYESAFIMNSAQQKLAECNKEKDVLVEKLQAVPALLEEIDAKRDLLLDAYAEGMKRDRFLQKKDALAVEERKIRKQETEYKEQISHYDTLIAEVKKSLDYDYNIDTDDKIDAFIDRSEIVWNRVSGITDDKERSAIIHKHFKKVIVENTTFNYSFQIHPQGKNVKAKKITIYPYAGGERRFVYISNDGKGGTMLELNKSAGERFVLPGTDREVVVPEYSIFKMEYLQRLSDIGKKKRRAENRAIREKETKEAIIAIRKQGYISMDDMIVKTGLSYSTLYHAIKEGRLEGKKVAKTWFVKRTNYETYIKRFPPKPREKKNKEHYQDIAKQRLLNAVLHPELAEKV